ncbi:MAG: Bug family tripartite tricarboxylate transporter substrate binding protein [Xanthobacteraceae bacterium]
MASLRLLVGVLVALIGAGAGAAAQTWPTRAIQVVSPFTAGNATDTVGRVVLDPVSRQVGQSFVIENRTGGGGTLGAAQVAKAERDGYTLLLHSSSLSSQVVLHKTLPYDPLRDFTAISLFGIQPSVLVVSPSKGYNSVADLVAAAKARPGALNFASAGIGAASHMAAERLRLAAHIEVQHIPFRGPVEAFTEVMAGRIDYYFLPIAPAMPHILDGKLKALAVSTPKRAQALPDVPTVAEAGYPDAQYLFWSGLSGPTGLPRPIVDKLHDEVQKALELVDTRDKLAKLGVELMPMSVDQAESFFREDVAATIKLAKEANIAPSN